MSVISSRLQLCTFRLGDLYLGIDVREVQEVMVEPVITPVANAHDAILGLINLRGQIATAIALRHRFGMEPSDDESKAVHVVVRLAGEWVSLVIDHISDVREVDPESYEPCPETLDPAYKELIIGTYKLADELLLVVDIAAAVSLHETGEQ